MEVKFKNDYLVIITTYATETYEHTDDTILEDFINCVNGDRCNDEDCLRGAFEEYIRDYCDTVPVNIPSNKEIEDYCINFELKNWDEIYPIISYMVEAPKEVTCCDKAPFGANFCPACGNQLINKK
jgi:hypothetical protein